MTDLVAVLVFVLLVGFRSAHVDRALIPDEKGSQLVESVTRRIEASCIFPNDNLLLRRIAYVETADGNRPEKGKECYHGGIWKVDEKFFSTTKSSHGINMLGAYIKKINVTFGIDWDNVTYEECRKPLVSALAARLYIHYTSRNFKGGIPRDISKQADFWKTHYRTNGKRLNFIALSKSLENKCHGRCTADIVFLIDGSGSIARHNFLKMKTFVKNIVQSFEIGPTKFGLIHFASNAKVVFNLNSYNTSTDIVRAVDRVKYMGGKTRSDLALRLLVENTFLERNGGRPSGVPKLGIVLTDGVSNNRKGTLVQAKRVHESDITMIVIGIKLKDLVEFEAIASHPTCSHFFLLTTFKELPSFKCIIHQAACEAPISFKPGKSNSSILRNETLHGHINIPPGNTIITLYTHSGKESILLLANDTFPSSSFYEMKVTSKRHRPGTIRLSNPSSEERVLFSTLLGSESSPVKVSLNVEHTELVRKCVPNPCQNKGKCNIVSLFDYTCTCQAGYYGDRCLAAISADRILRVTENENPALVSITPQSVLITQMMIPSEGATITLSTLSGGVSHMFMSENTFPEGRRFFKNVTSTEGSPAMFYIKGNKTADAKNWIMFSKVIGSESAVTNVSLSILRGETTRDCKPNPCQNDGLCNALSVHTFSCTCKPGYFGDKCIKAIPENNTLNPGQNHIMTSFVLKPGESFINYVMVPSAGATVKLFTLNGEKLNLILAENTFPGAEFYRHKVTAQDPGVIFIEKRKADLSGDSIVLINVTRSGRGMARVVLSIKQGDTRFCTSTPCINGKCTEQVDRFRCDCTKGYTGALCESSIVHNCLPNPCQNGGHCNAVNASEFTCTCRRGYYDNECRKELSKDDILEPGNHGTSKVLLITHGIPHLSQIVIPPNGATVSVFTSSRDSIKMILAENTFPGGRIHHTVTSSLQKPAVFHVKRTGPVHLKRNSILFCTLTGNKLKDINVTVSIKHGGISRNCKPNPCENGGQCNTLTPYPFTCYCPIGYYGEKCHNVLSDGIILSPDEKPMATALIYPNDQLLAQIKIPAAGAAIEFITLMGEQTTLTIKENAFPGGGNFRHKVTSIYEELSVFHVEKKNSKDWIAFCEITGSKTKITRITLSVKELVKHRPLAALSCVPNPCQNGGRCELTNPETLACACPAGFYGHNCLNVLSDAAVLITDGPRVSLRGSVPRAGYFIAQLLIPPTGATVTLSTLSGEYSTMTLAYNTFPLRRLHQNTTSTKQHPATFHLSHLGDDASNSDVVIFCNVTGDPSSHTTVSIKLSPM